MLQLINLDKLLLQNKNFNVKTITLLFSQMYSFKIEISLTSLLDLGTHLLFIID